MYKLALLKATIYRINPSKCSSDTPIKFCQTVRCHISRCYRQENTTFGASHPVPRNWLPLKTLKTVPTALVLGLVELESETLRSDHCSTNTYTYYTTGCPFEHINSYLLCMLHSIYIQIGDPKRKFRFYIGKDLCSVKIT